MAGVLIDNGDRVGVEASGVYKGILTEDMIDTIRRVKKPFIDVFISDLFFEDADYPLTFIPTFNMVLPLKKDQEVWVYFNQENRRYPVLWKLVDEYDRDSGFLKDYKLPSDGQDIQFPKEESTLEVSQISKDVWVIATKSYGVFYSGDQCVLLGDNGVWVYAPGSVNLKSKTVNIEADNINLKADNINLKASKVGVN